MSEPTSALSFYDLIKRVAIEAGIAYYGADGDEQATIPVDAHDFDLCKRVVNDGIRMFIADAPPKGWRWMHRIMSVNLTATRITGTVDSLSDTTLVDATLCEALGTMTADDASATTLVDATLSASYDTDDELVGYYCYIISGTGAGSYAPITDYDASTGTITVADWLTSGGLPGGTDPVATDTFGISTKKIQVGYYCYVVTGTGKGSWAVIIGFDSSNGTVTVADWLDAYGNAGGTNPGVGSTFAITPIETVAGDITRYPLAENFGGEVDGPVKYEPSSSHGTNINWCDESQIRARQAVSTLTGYPKLAAIRPLEYASGGFGPKRRFELIIDKKPSAAEVLEFPYTLFFDELRMVAGVSSGGTATTLVDSSFAKYYPNDYFNDDWKIYIIAGTAKNARGVVTDFTGSDFTVTVDNWLGIDDSADAGEDPTDSTDSAYYIEPLVNLHPAGFRFDQAILAACMAQAEIDIEDVTAGFVEKYIKKALPQAHRIDLRSAPRKLGSMDRIKYYDRQGARSNVITDHDI